MEQLEKRYNAIENGDTTQIETAIRAISKKENIFRRFIFAIKKLLFGDIAFKENNSDIN